MYFPVDLDKQNEYIPDVLLERDWSMLNQLRLCNFGYTQGIVESLMRPLVHSLNWTGLI